MGCEVWYLGFFKYPPNFLSPFFFSKYGLSCKSSLNNDFTYAERNTQEVKDK